MFMMINSESQLREIYGYPKGRARVKVLTSLEKHSIYYITHSSFIVMSTVDESGRMDASPRGGDPGFIKILNNQKIIIPDFKGNNRIDSLTNIIETGIIGILFLIPGIDETLRINGKAQVTTSENYLTHFSDLDKPPISCTVVSIEEIFLHCAKAFMRSKLWDEKFFLQPADFPSIGQMLKDQLNHADEAETREEMIKRYQKDI